MVDQKGLRQKTALITGASSGIGREIACLLAHDRHNLLLVARQRQRLEQIADTFRRQHNISVVVISKDLSVPAAVGEIYAEVRNMGIEVDVLVNAAGFNVYGPFAETNLASELGMIQVNLVALTSLTKLFMRDMVHRGFGRILNVASTASFSPLPLDSVYGATKAYVLSFSEAIAEELKGTGVTVTALCPGPTATEFAERAQMTNTKLFRGSLMSAAEVASIGYEALMRGQTTAVPGLTNKALVFSVRLSPRSMVTKLAREMLSTG
jgi:short-subunit dehydrogenase